MSKAGDLLKNSNICFTIPEINNFGYSKVGNNLWAAIFVINKGYIEADSLEACEALCIYADKYMKEYFTPVGGVDIIKKSDGTRVYRQRFYFNDITKFFRVARYFDIVIKIPKTFKINKRYLQKFRDIYSGLKKCLSNNKILENFTVEKWITYSCLLQLLLFAKVSKTKIDSYLSIEELSIHGILDNAPYLCGSYERGTNYIKNTSIIIPNDEDMKVDLYTVDGITVSSRDKKLKLKGFIDRD